MELEFMLKKIKKLKYFIVISLIIVFLLGYVSALIFNTVKYRSIGEVDFYSIGSVLSKDISSDFYYYFFRWYKAYQKDYALEPNGLLNYYENEKVLQKTYDYIISQGYSMDYDTFK